MWITGLFFLVMTVHGGQCACPASCSCSGNNVTCAGLTTIPEDISQNVTNLKLINTSFTEIQSYTFVGFENMRSFQIYDGIIETIRPFAISGLNTADITFVGCVIESLEPYAISKIEVLGKLKFHNCTISYLDQSAISNIDYIGTVEFFESNITAFRPLAVSSVGVIDTVTIYKCNITLLEGAFSSILELKMVIVASSYIGTVGSFAFSNITQVGQIQFVQSSVSEMKSYAFTQLGKVGILGSFQSNFTVIRRRAILHNNLISIFSWTFSWIGVFESFAVSKNTKFTTLSFYQMHVGHFQSFAFNDTTLKFADFQYNTIDQLDCGTIERLKDTVAVRLTFKPVNVACNNNICWVFHPNRTEYLRTVFKDVRCSTPRANVTSGLGAPTDMSLEDFPFNCSTYDYTTDFTCSGSARPWRLDVIKTDCYSLLRT